MKPAHPTCARADQASLYTASHQFPSIPISCNGQVGQLMEAKTRGGCVGVCAKEIDNAQYRQYTLEMNIMNVNPCHGLQILK